MVISVGTLKFCFHGINRDNFFIFPNKNLKGSLNLLIDFGFILISSNVKEPDHNPNDNLFLSKFSI